MTNGSNSLHFYYDAQNRPAVVEFNWVPYAYVHNLQGDIIAIVDANGTKVVEYKYDAWGKPIAKTGTLASTLGTLNPFRYRGYVYDEETELYYNSIRYYSVNWNRFISPDILLDENAGVLKLNTYIYVANNPVNNSDASGHWIFKDAIKWFAKNVTQPIVEGVESLLKDVNFTLSIGFVGSFSLGFWAYSGQIGVSMDARGNFAIQATGSVALTTGTPGVSGGVYVFATNAPNIDNLEDEALGIGGSVSCGYMLGGEVNIIPDYANDKTYYGATLVLGVGTPGGEVHISGAYTATVPKSKYNFFSIYKKGFERVAAW